MNLINRYLQGTDFERAIRKQSPTPEDAELILGNVAAFKEHAARHTGSISQFLEDIEPLIDSVPVNPPAESHVWISSIHRAKERSGLSYSFHDWQKDRSPIATCRTKRWRPNDASAT